MRPFSITNLGALAVIFGLGCSPAKEQSTAGLEQHLGSADAGDAGDPDSGADPSDAAPASDTATAVPPTPPPSSPAGCGEIGIPCCGGNRGTCAADSYCKNDAFKLVNTCVACGIA